MVSPVKHSECMRTSAVGRLGGSGWRRDWQKTECVCSEKVCQRKLLGLVFHDAFVWTPLGIQRPAPDGRDIRSVGVSHPAEQDL